MIDTPLAKYAVLRYKGILQSLFKTPMTAPFSFYARVKIFQDGVLKGLTYIKGLTMLVKELYEKGSKFLNKTEDIALLFLRIILVYTFYGPATAKFENIEATAGFFEYLGIPLPLLNAYMAAGTELVGAVLLALGFFTRFISIPLLFVMIVAIATVHGANGFHMIMPGDMNTWKDPYINGEAVKGTVVVLQNGYEMVMYYMAMLMVLISKGAGRLSLDHLLFKKS